MSKSTQIGNIEENIFPYDYVENRKKITPDSHKHRVKGNWSCNPDLWYDKNRRPDFTIIHEHPYNKIGDGPEGPKTQRQTDSLTKLLFNERTQKWSKLVKFDILTEKFKLDVSRITPFLGYRLKDIFCKGKHYFIKLICDSNESDINQKELTIHAHHMMGGNWNFNNTRKHDHIKLTFSDNKKNTIIFYNDTRFAKFEFLTEEESLNIERKLAPGFIGRKENQHTLQSWINRKDNFTKRKSLLALLRSQEDLCSELGNYLIAEVLYAAKLHPKIVLKDIDIDLWVSLFYIVRKVVRGHYDRSLEKLVYGKKLTPNGEKVVSQKISGRTIWWVPEIQLKK